MANVLIVDDSSTMRKIISRSLRQAGLSVDEIYEAGDGIEGLNALKNNKGSEIAFLMGTAPDHLFDLVSELAKAIGAPAPLRFGGQSLFEGWATLTQAAQDVFGQEALPFFDIGGADLVLSFGAPFLGPWFSQVAFTRAFSQMRKGASTGHRGTFVQFEPRLSQTAARADHWIPIKPGTEGMVALALGRIAAGIGGGTLPQVFSDVDVEAVAAASNISVEKLQELGQMLAAAKAPLAIPGGGALAHSNGLETAKSVLALNAFVGNLGLAGGRHLMMLPFDGYPEGFHRQDHLGADILLAVDGRNGKVAFLVARFVAQVRFFVPAAVPDAFHAVKVVIAFMGVLVEAYIIEDEELGLWTEECRVANAR